MRPVEHKLKYQIEKLLKIATTGKLGENDPLQFKANPENLISKVFRTLNGSYSVQFVKLLCIIKVADTDDSSEEDSKKKKNNKSKVYVPPKLAATPYGKVETVDFTNPFCRLKVIFFLPQTAMKRASSVFLSWKKKPNVNESAQVCFKDYKKNLWKRRRKLLNRAPMEVDSK